MTRLYRNGNKRSRARLNLVVKSDVQDAQKGLLPVLSLDDSTLAIGGNNLDFVE